MVFSSILFLLCFLPCFLLIYYITPSRFKNIVILASSIFFYTWGAPKFIAVILASILLDFVLARLIHSETDKRRKKILLAASVTVNLLVLLYFKYANFFVENVNAVFTGFGMKQLAWTTVALPIGISFFTFHELSYIIDVYRGVKPPMKKLSEYAVYIMLFPQLIAGPIIRFHEISDQITERKHRIHADNAFAGFFRFVIGLSKKVLIANVLGEYADAVFDSHVAFLNSYTIWIGALAYTFQIYFDFSGYSDMAIGLARMMGFVFPENFNNPYISQSITEFWQRWHMSLSRWMKDYLYIPLGGSRVTAARLYMNLCIVFVVSGLWHGAQWTFVLWGVYHGVFLIFDRIFLTRITSFIGKPIRILITFIIIVVGWVFFRAEDAQSAFLLAGRMFLLTPPSFAFPPSLKFYAVLVVASLFCFIVSSRHIERFSQTVFEPKGTGLQLAAKGVVIICLLFLCMADLLGSSFNPFIYFRF